MAVTVFGVSQYDIGIMGVQSSEAVILWCRHVDKVAKVDVINRNKKLKVVTDIV